MPIETVDWNDLQKQPGVHPPTSTSEDHGSFVENLGRSVQKFGGDLYSAITNPHITASSIFDLTEAYLNKLNPRGTVNADKTKMADAMNKHLTDRYGSIGNIKKTAYEDPIGFAADLSTVLGGIGVTGNVVAKAAKLAGVANTAKVATVAAKVAKTGKLASEVTNPFIALKGAQKVGDLATAGATAAGLERTANLAKTLTHPLSSLENPSVSMYRKVFKPSGTVAEGDARTRTLLKEGIGHADEAKAWERIGDYSDEAKNMMDDPRAAELAVNPASVTNAEPVQALTREAEQGGKPGVSFAVQATGADDLGEVQRAIDQFTREHFTPAVPAKMSQVLDSAGQPIELSPAVPPQPIPIPLSARTAAGETVYPADAVKSGTYKMISNKQKGGGTMASQPIPHANQQTQYALARGIREDIGNKLAGVGIGDIHEVNKAEGAILDAMPDIQRNAVQDANAGVGMNLKNLITKSLYSQVPRGMYGASQIDIPTFITYLRNLGMAGGRLNDSGLNQ